jgi:hypothetical protein
MDVNTIWSAVLTLTTGVISLVLREKFAELKRIDILLNKTREEIAKEYVTQLEVQRITDHIDQRFNRLEAKIDQLIQGKSNAK